MDPLEPYREAIRAHGPSFEATLWASREWQMDRFAVIADMVDLSGRVIIDAGCALADLAEFLDTARIPYGRYIGLEALPELASAARARRLPETEIVEGDFGSDPDALARLIREHRAEVVIFSGALNTFEQDAALEVLDRAHEALFGAGGTGRGERRGEAGGEALVFNFLSSRNHRSPGPPSPAKRFDPVAVLDWALERTPNVRFRQDYFDGHDATVAMLPPPGG